MKMGGLVRENILKIKPYQPGKPIEELQREMGLKEVIKLASNENALGPSPLAVKAAKAALPGVNRYPDANCYYLKRRLARKLRVKPEQLIISNGSDEIIVLATRAFLGGGDEVIISEPSFLIYRIAVAASGVKIVSCPLRDFRYDLKAMKDKITARTKLIFIANPDNPSGTYVTEKEVASFFRGLPAGIIVFFDEAYFEFVEEGDFPDTLRYLGKRDVIITRTFSKAYGLSGLRVGYGMSSPEIIGYLNRVREPFNVNLLAQAAALAALKDREHLKKTKRLVREGKKYLYREFARMGLTYVKSAANFILVDVGCPGEKLYRRLLKSGIIVRAMGAWGLDNFIRVTVGRMEENRRFIRELERISELIQNNG